MTDLTVKFTCNKIIDLMAFLQFMTADSHVKYFICICTSAPWSRRFIFHFRIFTSWYQLRNF